MTKKKRQVRLLAAIAALAALGLLYVLVSRADWNGEEDDTDTEEIEALSIAPCGNQRSGHYQQLRYSAPEL